MATTPQFRLCRKDVSVVKSNKFMSYYPQVTHEFIGCYFVVRVDTPELKSLQCQQKVLFLHAEHISYGRPTDTLVGSTLLCSETWKAMSHVHFQGKLLL